jgi:hypothetical protein
MVEGMPKLISRGSLRNFSGLAAGWEHPLAEAPAKGLGRMVFSVPPLFCRDFMANKPARGSSKEDGFQVSFPSVSRA